MQNIGTVVVESNESFLPIWKEIVHRAANVTQFFYNVENSILFELYGVPIPERENVKWSTV